jgi:hypothetical protein
VSVICLVERRQNAVKGNPTWVLPGLRRRLAFAPDVAAFAGLAGQNNHIANAKAVNVKPLGVMLDIIIGHPDRLGMLDDFAQCIGYGCGVPAILFGESFDSYFGLVANTDIKKSIPR